MKNYEFNDNTLLHSLGFNFATFVSIMNNGIMSFNYAKKNNIDFVRNYNGFNLDDTISCVRYLYANENVLDGSYYLHVMNGISFIIEDVLFIYDKSERLIHRYDEVLVKDYIDVSKIVGILIPENYCQCHLDELEYIKEDSTSFSLIKHNVDNIRSFINSDSSYDDFYRELYYINEAYDKEKDNDEKASLRDEFSDIISDLNEFIGIDMEKYFKNKLNKDDVVLIDIVNYLNNMGLKLPIFYVNNHMKVKKTQ